MQKNFSMYSFVFNNYYCFDVIVLLKIYIFRPEPEIPSETASMGGAVSEEPLFEM